MQERAPQEYSDFNWGRISLEARQQLVTEKYGVCLGTLMLCGIRYGIAFLARFPNLMALMKKTYFVSLLCIIVCMAQQVYAVDVSPSLQKDTEIVERGGWFSRLRYRSELRAYSYKIYARQISYEELKDYLVKGGDPSVLSDYGADNPFMKDTELPLLNYFIKGKFPFEPYLAPGANSTNDISLMPPPPADYETDARPDRLRSLKLLLDNGAMPDRMLNSQASQIQSASSLLWASWLGDVDAMRLLIDYGADINQIQRGDSCALGSFGPPILVAQGDAAADLIYAHHPKMDIDVKDGRNIVQELLMSTEYSTLDVFVQQKMAWLQSKGIKFKWPKGAFENAVTIASERQRGFAAKNYSAVNPFLLPGPERARIWGEITASLKAMQAS